MRAPVDAFFLDVTVNADDPALRLNRLRLLNELREAVHTVADFSKIAGDAAPQTKPPPSSRGSEAAIHVWLRARQRLSQP